MWIYNVFMFFSLASRSCTIFGILFGWLWFKKRTKKTQKNKKRRGIFHLMKYIFWQLSTNTFSFLLSPERLDSTSLNWTKLTDREDQCYVDVIQETSEHFPLMFLFSCILYYYLVVFFYCITWRKIADENKRRKDILFVYEMIDWSQIEIRERL